jgi:hypothetical protein
MNKSFLFAFLAVGLVGSATAADSSASSVKVVEGTANLQVPVKVEVTTPLPQPKVTVSVPAKEAIGTFVNDVKGKITSITKDDVKKFVTSKKFLTTAAAVVTGYIVYKAVTKCNWVREKLGLEPVVTVERCDACYLE